MNIHKKRQIFSDMKSGICPVCLPIDVIGFTEYRKDIYNQGEPAKDIKAGDILLSADGTKKHTKDGGIWDLAGKQKYHNWEDVINVDLNKFIIEDVNEVMLSKMQNQFNKKSQTHVTVPWHYGTLMTRCQIEFGWEPLLEASALEPESLKPIIDHIALSTLSVLDGWSRLEKVDLVIMHDDIASTQGLIWSPEFLKKYVLVWYKKFFDKIHENGKKVLYITDGNYLKIIDDLLLLKPDGLYIESSSIDPSAIMEKGGKDLFYLLKTDSRIMDFGNESDIKSEVMRIQNLHKSYPKIFSYTGGGLVKPENKLIFEKYYNKYLVYN